MNDSLSLHPGSPSVESQTFWDNNNGANFVGHVYDSPIASPIDRQVMEHETLYVEPGSSHILTRLEVCNVAED